MVAFSAKNQVSAPILCGPKRFESLADRHEPNEYEIMSIGSICLTVGIRVALPGL